MKIKSYYVVSLAISLLLLLSSCKESYVFEYKLNSGDKFLQTINIETRIIQKMGDSNFDLSEITKMIINYDVSDVKGDIYFLDAKLSKAELVKKSGIDVIEKTGTNVKGSENYDHFDDMLNSVLGDSFLVMLNKHRGVDSVRGIENIYSKMQSVLDSTKNDQEKEELVLRFSENFSEGLIKSVLGQIFVYYSQEPVKVGNMWNKKSEFIINNVKVFSDLNIKLEQVKDNVATFRCEGNVNTPEGGDMVETLGVESLVVMDGNYESTINVDLKTGLPINSKTTHNIGANIDVQGIKVAQRISYIVTSNIKL